MKTQVLNQKYKNSFQGIDSEHELKKEADLRLFQLLALAPPGAYSLATVDHTGKTVVAEVDVFSPYRTFSAFAVGFDAQSAVRRALDKLEDQLYQWRWGSGRGNDSSMIRPPVDIPKVQKPIRNQEQSV